jgi:FixJ family two-component response regulator
VFVHVVDDDASFRTAIERRLKHAGYEVATYSSADDLLARLPSDSLPGCLLLDVRIPGLDGPALQKRLGDLGSTLPIIFLTGNPDIPTTVQAIKAGAEEFLIKPVTSVVLLAAIERALTRHDVSRKLQSELNFLRARVATLTPRERQVEARSTNRLRLNWARPNGQSRCTDTGSWRRWTYNRWPNWS